MAALITGANPSILLEGHGVPRGTAGDQIMSSSTSNVPTAADWASIWGPAAFDVNFDKDRNRRTSRMHLSQLPQELQGRQIYIEVRDKNHHHHHHHHHHHYHHIFIFIICFLFLFI